MPSIRDLVTTIRQRDGVDAAIIVGRDGLLIDAQIDPRLSAEDVAAHIPAIIAASDEFGVATGRGSMVTAVLEHEAGLAIASVLSDEAILLVLVNPRANMGELLFELRRNREHIASLV